MRKRERGLGRRPKGGGGDRLEIMQKHLLEPMPRTKRQSCADVSARLDLGRTQRIRPRLRANRTRLKWPRLRASAGPVAHATHTVSRVSGDHIQPAHTQTRRRPRITRRRTPVPWRWTLEKERPVLTRRPPFEKGRRASAGGRERGWARACHFQKCCSERRREEGSRRPEEGWKNKKTSPLCARLCQEKVDADRERLCHCPRRPAVAAEESDDRPAPATKGPNGSGSQVHG